MTRYSLLVTVVMVMTAGSLPGRNFFDLANQGFQYGGRSGVATDTTFGFSGPLFVLDEPDYFGPAAGVVDVDSDGSTIWARALGGYDSNPAGIVAGDGAWFGGAQVGASENFSFGPQNVFLGARAKYLQYGGDIFAMGREGDDRGIFDTELRLGLNRQFGQSVELTTFYNLSLGGTRELGQPFVLPGIDMQNFLLLRASSQLAYRFDRAPLSDPGWVLATALRPVAFIGLDNDDRDFQRFEARQSVARVLDPKLALGVEGRVGTNTWNDWDMLDSTSYYLLATASGRTAGGLSYQAAAGWEWWSYDETMIDERDDFYAEMKVSGELNERFYLAGGLTYGIDTVSPQRLFGSADPMGLRAGAMAVWHSEVYTVSGLLSYTWYEADLLPSSEGHWDRWSAGLSVDRALGTNSRLGVAFEYAAIDTDVDDFEDVETTVRWTQDF